MYFLSLKKKKNPASKPNLANGWVLSAKLANPVRVSSFLPSGFQPFQFVHYNTFSSEEEIPI